MNLRELTEDWLKRNSLNGLYNADGECACKLGNLMPCESPSEDCVPGVETSCDTKFNVNGCGGDCQFHIINPDCFVIPGADDA